MIFLLDVLFLVLCVSSQTGCLREGLRQFLSSVSISLLAHVDDFSLSYMEENMLFKGPTQSFKLLTKQFLFNTNAAASR